MFTFMIGATMGITTVTGIPKSAPWYARAWAWLPKHYIYIDYNPYNVLKMMPI